MNTAKRFEMAKVVAKFLVEVFFTWTGEIILSFITFGYHTPRWLIYADYPAQEYAVPRHAGRWIGAAVWLTIALSCIGIPW